MNANLVVVAKRIEQAAMPEDVFGKLDGSGGDLEANLKQTYHQIAKVTHPDVYPDREDKYLAQTAFRRLAEWYALAVEKIRAGRYGSETEGSNNSFLRTKRGTYTIDTANCDEGVYNLYRGHLEEKSGVFPVTLKVTRDAHDNDLAQNEARILQVLMAGRGARKFAAYIPKWIESFFIEEDGISHFVNAFERQAGWVSFADVHAAYPRGIDPKDAAWMWRRLLVALGFAHINGIIHGAVLPGSVFILTEAHGLVLDNWGFAALDPDRTGEIITAVDANYEGLYPNEVRNSEPPVPGTDIAMAARCMIFLLGGDPVTGSIPARAPAAMQMFLKGCILPGKRARPQDAWGLKEEFDELLEKLWGERKFHPFSMNPMTTNRR